MTERALQLKDELLKLSFEDRFELANILCDSVDPPGNEYEDEAAWIAELDRRSAEMDANPESARPVEEVFAELRAEYQPPPATDI